MTGIVWLILGVLGLNAVVTWFVVKCVWRREENTSNNLRKLQDNWWSEYEKMEPLLETLNNLDDGYKYSMLLSDYTLNIFREHTTYAYDLGFYTYNEALALLGKEQLP